MSALLRRVAAASIHVQTASSSATSSEIDNPRPSTSNAPADTSIPDDDVAALIPLSIISNHIETHPLVLALKVPTEEAHAAIVRLHAFMYRQPKHQEKEPVKVPPKCLECKKGYMNIDAHNGHYVCSFCGICSRGQINVEPEYQAPPEVNPRGKRKRGIPGVPAWVLKKNQSVDPSIWTHSSYWEEIEAFNESICHMALDDLEQVDWMLRNWKATGGDTREARMAAAMLYFRLKDSLPTENDIRQQLRCHRGLREVKCGPPEPEFECQYCDRMHYTKKGARFCYISNRCNR
jgi:hypothetical protein